MKKKRLLLYGLLIGVLLGLVAGFYVYREYLGEDPDLNPNVLANPIENEKLRAIITKKSVRKTGDGQKLVLDYIDLDNQKTDHLLVSDYYGRTIQLGDTLTKDKGEKIVVVYQKNGNVETVPID